MRVASTAIITGDELPRAAEVEFVRCVHCGRHHAVRQSIAALALGRPVLGFCARCNGVHCPACAKCVPNERQLDNIEAGRHPLDASRVSVVIPRAIGG